MSATFENTEDIKRMQQEAVKRVREMQKRAKISLEYSNYGTNNPQKNNFLNHGNKNVANSPKDKTDDHLEKNNTKLQNPKSDKNTYDLIKDSEKSLILLLILLLLDENVDIGLIIALFYIMM